MAAELAIESATARRNLLSLIRLLVLVAIAGAAIASRLFAVIRFESIIHEFNFRATKVLTTEGFYSFWHWFDESAWYPLGRAAGGTLYPGIMITSALIHNALRAINIPVDIRNVCVMLAPGFSGLTAFSTYMFARELGRNDDGTGGEGTGLWAALFIAIAPGYISRSVAGSYDNEAIAIFILMATFALWLRALKTGSALWGTATALSYFYMVSAWGGYAFITNMLPLHAFALVLMGRFSTRLYVSYSAFYAVGTLASMQVPFVGFQPIRTSEHMAALGVFGLLQLVAFAELVRSLLPSKQFRVVLRTAVLATGVLGFGTIVGLTYKGWIAPWTGRFYSLWDTGYAKIHIPLIPTAWPSFFFDLQMLIYMFPAGVFMCFKSMREEHVFVIIYAAVASYFAGVMVRLMLTLTPVVCVSAAMVMSSLYTTYLQPQQDVLPPLVAQAAATSIVDEPAEAVSTAVAPATKTAKKRQRQPSAQAAAVDAPVASRSSSASLRPGLGWDMRALLVAVMTGLVVSFCIHSTWVTSTAYSSPSVVLASRNPDGSQNIIDDFREAYYWLRQNTPKTAKVMSWWDYGYQIAGFADRTTLVDNCTWNNTHIATVGKAMATREEVAYPILRSHDVDYVLVIFGGLIGFSGDDINKFLWMIRISEGIWPSEVSEQSFFTSRGEYKVDDNATPAMRNSLMYKMSYGQPAQDRVRNQQLPRTGPTLDTLDEAFTSTNWIVRIYAVKREDPFGRELKAVSAFEGGKRRKRSKARSSTSRRA